MYAECDEVPTISRGEKLPDPVARPHTGEIRDDHSTTRCFEVPFPTTLSPSSVCDSSANRYDRVHHLP